MLDSEANVELRLVVPLLEALGYDRNVDIDSKYPVDFQQGRKPMPGRKPEGDIVCFNGALHDRDTSLLAVEAKASNQPLPPGKVQGESYAQNLRAPLLLLTNGQEFEIWQQQASLESECVLAIAVSDLAANRGTVERLLNKTAVRDYCAGLKFKTIVEATADFGPYETAELLRLRSDPPAIARTLTVPQAGGTKIEIESGKLLGGYKSGAIVVAPSGYGKSTLARSLFKQAIEERWREHHKPVAIEASLPDIEASGVDLLPFLHQRLQAHIPGIMEQTFRDLVRTVGVTVICDSMDRTSHAFQKRVTTAISLLLRDYPLSQVFLFSRALGEDLLAELVREGFVPGFRFGQLDQKLAHRSVARIFRGLAVVALGFVFHVFGEFAHLIEAERARQPQRRLVLDETSDVLAAYQRQIFAEFRAVEIEQHGPMMHFLVGHLVENLGGVGELLAQAFGEAAVNAAVLFLIGDGKRQHFLFGEIGKSFHGAPLVAGRPVNSYIRIIPDLKGLLHSGLVRPPRPEQ
mgnify:CR=1 FL=1